MNGQGLALKYTKKKKKKKKNYTIQKIGVAMETVRKISIFFTFVFINQYKLKKWAKIQKNLFFLFPSHIGKCLIFSESDS